MPAINVNKISKTYRVRKLTYADADEVFALCEKNKLYYEYHPPFVTKNAIEEDMRAAAREERTRQILRRFFRRYRTYCRSRPYYGVPERADGAYRIFYDRRARSE